MSSTSFWSGVGLSPPGAPSPLKYALSMSVSASPAATADILLCCRLLSEICRRPLRAAVASRFRSSEEGGVRSVGTGDFEDFALWAAAFLGRLADLRALFFAIFTVFLPAFLAGLFAAFRAFFFPRFFAITIPLKSLTGLH